MNLTPISKETTYSLTPAELENLLAEWVREKGHATKDQKVSVDYTVGDTSDDRFGGYPSYNLTRIKITVKG